jgi:hypothetical protein
MPSHYCIKVVFDGKIAHFVAKKVNFSSFGGVDIGKEIKIETLFEQHFLVHRGFFFRNEIIQNPAVFLKFGIYIPDIIGHFPVFAVVVTVAALVGTEFFINPPNYGLVTFGTRFIHDFKFLF